MFECIWLPAEDIFGPEGGSQKATLVVVVLVISSLKIPRTFYPRDAMLARVYATATCLSVCHTLVLCLAERKQDREMYTI